MKEIYTQFKTRMQTMHPAKLACWGYITYIVAGWLILCLPVCQKGVGVKSLDNLFTSMSAISTTGLVTVSLSDNYSFWGQLVVMILIQLGGIGYMTLGSFVILSRKNALTPLRSEIGMTVFSLPQSFRIDKFIHSVIWFTLMIEMLGAVALYFPLRNSGESQAVWSAIFHSISVFCTAGFGLKNNSFMDYADHFWINLILGVLSYLGAIGFIVCVDFWRKWTGKVKEITLTSKIILWTTVWLSLVGTGLLFLSEPQIQNKPADARLLEAFFQSMTAFTTVGFNTIDIGQMSKASLLLLVVLMVIGASPSGTGGGLKSTTFSAIVGVMKSAIFGEKEVTFWGKPVPLERIWSAVASLGFYLSTLIIGTYLLEMSESTPFLSNLFEAASALGTVGLSMGITASLSNLGKLILILLMFSGRLGPLTFGMALFFRTPSETKVSDSDLAV